MRIRKGAEEPFSNKIRPSPPMPNFRSLAFWASWAKSRAGKVRLEGWPSYSLEATDRDTTIVRHHAKMHTHGPYRAATPLLRRIALKERTTTVEALKASFE